MQRTRRRSFLAGVAGVWTIFRAADALAEARRPRVPLTAGSRFGRWSVVEVNPHAGALRVVVKGDDAAPFTLEVMARDHAADAVIAPATTEHLAVFVRNGGNGEQPTNEDHGLAAITLAAHLAKSGDAEMCRGLLTHRDRLAHPGV